MSVSVLAAERVCRRLSTPLSEGTPSPPTASCRPPRLTYRTPRISPMVSVANPFQRSCGESLWSENTVLFSSMGFWEMFWTKFFSFPHRNPHSPTNTPAEHRLVIKRARGDSFFYRESHLVVGFPPIFLSFYFLESFFMQCHHTEFSPQAHLPIAILLQSSTAAAGQRQMSKYWAHMFDRVSTQKDWPKPRT